MYFVTGNFDHMKESVQNSITVQRQSECPSFTIGTDGAHVPCVLVSPLGPMAHTVPCFLGLTKEDS